jgi:hypothetical protein
MMSPADQIRNAANGFGFALFLHDAVLHDRLTVAAFVRELPVLTSAPGEPDTGFRFRQSYDKQALDDLTFNTVHSAAGMLAIVVDTALDEHFGAKPNPIVTEVDQLRALMYMLRCAFAHNPFHPKWEIRGRYQRVYGVPGASVTTDVTHLHGQDLVPNQFGGWEGFVRLAAHARTLVA